MGSKRGSWPVMMGLPLNTPLIVVLCSVLFIAKTNIVNYLGNVSVEIHKGRAI